MSWDPIEWALVVIMGCVGLLLLYLAGDFVLDVARWLGEMARRG